MQLLLITSLQKAFVDANDGLKILETPYVEEDYAMCFKKGNTELEDKFNAKNQGTERRRNI